VTDAAYHRLWPTLGAAPEDLVQFERLEQRTTPDAVLSVLRKAILDGSLPSGTALREQRISADLGISRAPLREALRILEEEGLVVRVPFRGTFVAEVGPTVVAEITSLRLRLEPFAIERGLTWLRGPGRVRLEEACAELSRAAAANDLAASIDSHLAIHRLLYESANHKLLLDLWQGWESQLRLFLAVDHRSFASLTDIAAAHQRLVEAIETDDMSAITEVLAQHVHGAPEAPAPAARAAE
jgi:DNA-binding GntR family transcriptional regulator